MTSLSLPETEAPGDTDRTGRHLLAGSSSKPPLAPTEKRRGSWEYFPPSAGLCDARKAALEPGKGQGADSPLQPPETSQPCPHLDLSPEKLTSDFRPSEL